MRYLRRCPDPSSASLLTRAAARLQTFPHPLPLFDQLAPLLNDQRPAPPLGVALRGAQHVLGLAQFLFPFVDRRHLWIRYRGGRLDSSFPFCS